MEAERLHSVLSAVALDAARFNIPNLLAQVEATFTQSLASPNQATSTAFEAALQALRDYPPQSECSRLSPSKQRILEAIGGAHIFGGLAERVTAILEQNRTTLASTVPALQRLRTEAEKFIQAAQAIRSGFGTLNIREDEAPIDQCEVGIVLPSELVQGNLEGFEKELKKFDRALKTFTELMTGNTASAEIRSIGTGTLDVFVSLDPISAAALLLAVERIVAIYKGVLESRKLHRELKEKEAPAKILDELTKWERTRVLEDLTKLREELIERRAINEKKRTDEEFKTLLLNSLKTLADRIDRGADVEVSAPEPTEGEGEEAAGEEPTEGRPEPNERRREALAYVRQKGAIVRSIERQPEPVLCIDSGTSEDAEDGETEAKGKVRGKTK